MDAERMLDNLVYCNAERFNGTNMLANRTINEFAGFVSSAIFGQEDTPEKVFVNKQKDLFPFKENTAIEDEFIIWSELFRRYYEVDR